jgi:DNA-binding transcriptional LysR family regulator
MDWRTVRFDWNRARAFLVSAEEGTFSAAGRALGLSQPTVGRQVAALEEELGVALFERVGHALELTVAGVELLEHVRAMGEAATRVSFAATGQASSVEGAVSLTASELIAAFVLPPVVARVREQYPSIELEIVASNSPQDLLRREADIAVRNFQPKELDLVARRLADRRAGLYAAPAYLARLGPVASLADLAGAEFFAFDKTSVMIDGLVAMGVPVTRANFPLVVANHLVQWELAKAGLGICFVMEEVGDAEPAMQRVISELAMPVQMWVTAHRELHTSRRIRVVFDLLVELLGAAAITAGDR